MATSKIKVQSSSADFIVRTLGEDNMTIPASTYDSRSYDANYAGYTPIGLVGYNVSNASSSGVNASWFSVRSAYVYYTSSINTYFAEINYRNLGTNQAKIKVALYVLYKKN